MLAVETMDAVQRAPIDIQEFRRASGCFTTGVAILTTVRPDGEPMGLTVNSFTSVSLAPPLVLVCVHGGSRVLEPLLIAGRFGINVLAADQRDLSTRFATDRSCALAWETGPTGVPLIPGALAVFECELSRDFDGGDHRILVGRVLRLAAGEGAPLVRYGSAYRGLEPDAGA
jgi:flavin reductase (DIM6/NTAB) family NADH-FMN oxidoreductase RutF